MVATRVSPAVVADVGDAASELPAVVLNAPNVPDSLIDALVRVGK